MHGVIPGLVIRETHAGDNGKFIELLTEESGIVEVYVRGVNKINNKTLAVTQLFSYAEYSVEKRKDKYYFLGARPIQIFYDLRSNLEFYSLASYFAEITRKNLPENYEGSEILRLLLNTFYMLVTERRPAIALKALFELRLATELGAVPNLYICDKCFAYLPENLVFSVAYNRFWCAECFDKKKYGDKPYYPMHRSGLNMIRFICCCDHRRMFNFKAGEETTKIVAAYSEDFFRYHIQPHSKALDFYKSIRRYDDY